MKSLPRALYIGLLWRLGMVFKHLGMSRLGILRFLEPVLVSKVSPHDRKPIFVAEPETRVPNFPNPGNTPPQLFPPIGFRKLDNALVTANRRFSLAIVGQKLLVQHAADPGPWNIRVGEPTVGGILRQSKSLILANVPVSSEKIDSGIFVGTASPQNWFHWLIDILPSVFIATKLPNEFVQYPLLLPEGYDKKATWLEPLNLLWGQREIITLPSKRYSRVKNLIWIDNPTSPGPLPSSHDSRARFRVHESALKEYRSAILDALAFEPLPPKTFRRLYIARKQDGNRPYNQHELLETAVAKGFEPVFLEDLSFRDSVKIMREASVVIGPHGAGWANVLFCQPETRGLMWTWDEASRDNWFSNVASVAQMEFRALSTGPQKVYGNNLDPRSLSTAIDRLCPS